MQGAGWAALCLCWLLAPAGRALLVPASAPRAVTLDRHLVSELDHISTGNIFIEVLSSPERCHVRVNGHTVLYRDKSVPEVLKNTNIYIHRMHANGMYAVSLHPTTGRRTGQTFASGHVPNAGYMALEQFVQHVQPGRVLVFCVLSEASMSLDAHGEALFRALNASFIPDMQARSMLAMVAVKDGPVLAEGYALNLDAINPGQVGSTLRMTATVPRALTGGGCLPPGHRADFCARHDGFAGVCDCDEPVWPRPRPEPRGALFPYPVIIIADNRANYLARCLASLLPNRGLDPDKVVVFVDGEYPDVKEVLAITNVRMHQYKLKSTPLQTGEVGARIGFIYRYVMETAFNMFPDVDKIVLLEQDLEVSPDFISYFNQTYHLLDIDPSLYCVSAWNDHGYNHTVGDPTQLYRIGFMPGLGWMLKRSLFFEELLPAWPDPWNDFDWDVMVRLQPFRKGRDCVIPDISRTYHFGFIGQHVETSMQFKYYYDHALNTIPDVELKDVDKMVYHKYEDLLMKELAAGVPLTDTVYGSPNRCDSILPEHPTNQTYVMCIKMSSRGDTAVWEKLATCLNLWDLDVRGDHRGIWRFWYGGNKMMIVGVPYAELADVATQSAGVITVFGGKRTAKQTALGRWPPGLPRDFPKDRKKRYQLSADALEVELPDE